MKILRIYILLLVSVVGILNPESTLAFVDYSQVPDNTWVLVDHNGSPPFGILGYSGMALDTINHKILLFGGGHNDYGGNEVYSWDINGTQTWTKMYEPTAFMAMTLAQCQAGVDNNNYPGMWVPTGRPLSRHTYTAIDFMSHSGEMVVSGSSTYSGPNDSFWLVNDVPPGCYYNTPGDMWLYNQANNTWTFKGAYFPGQKGRPHYIHSFTYDSYNHNVIVYGTGGGIWIYDPTANTWTEKFPTGTLPDNSQAYNGITYDSKRRRVYIFGSAYPYNHDLYYYDVSGNSWTKVSPSGNPPPLNSDVWKNGMFGLAYDSVNDVILAFGVDGNSCNLWVYSPTANSWTKNPGDSTPPAPANSVIYGHLKYDSTNNITFLVTSNTSYGVDVWAYRYKKGTTIVPAPPTGLTILIK